MQRERALPWVKKAYFSPWESTLEFSHEKPRSVANRSQQINAHPFHPPREYFSWIKHQLQSSKVPPKMYLLFGLLLFPCPSFLLPGITAPSKSTHREGFVSVSGYLGTRLRKSVPEAALEKQTLWVGFGSWLPTRASDGKDLIYGDHLSDEASQLLPLGDRIKYWWKMKRAWTAQENGN